ncbi:VPLPA-CTERM sorting domain-containing protein [Roseobacter sinensis]|uniref:VPLPA-CTERM sorting domain-containing protein n=1 Tax=Roseobacter sinensis TaxID=2931391 RepID=A0ABT3BJM2_9RHOB|nr:VPLPA-CTERM sorting domain-containing protein [Roseobacter sp. WL0113]MCV3273776.1 VPLPA-CTERM sorting domain-containing protein [Roseobacter sp. WL0113]
MKLFKVLAVSAVVALSGGAASAAVIFADTVISSSGGGVSDGIATPGDRTDVDNALGGADNTFYSLGLGGDIVLGFSTLGTGPVTTWEVTFGDIGTHLESANVFAVLGGVETLIGEVQNANAQGGQSLNFVGVFDSIKIVDTSPAGGGSIDGFDLDAVSVSAVPLPASALLLLGGLAGMGAMRRRKKA